MRGVGMDDRQHREKRESWTGNLEKLHTDLMKEAKSTKGTEEKQPRKQEENLERCSTNKPKEKKIISKQQRMVKRTKYWGNEAWKVSMEFNHTGHSWP